MKEKEVMKRAVTFSNEEWDQLGFFERMGLNKEEFIKTKSEEYFENHFVDMQNENKREDGDENKREDGDEKEQEDRKIREEEERKIREEEERKIREEEERKIREEEERKIREEEDRQIKEEMKIREDFISSSNQLQVLLQNHLNSFILFKLDLFTISHPKLRIFQVDG